MNGRCVEIFSNLTIVSSSCSGLHFCFDSFTCTSGWSHDLFSLVAPSDTKRCDTMAVVSARCAGIVGAAKNDVGIVGVAPGARLVAIRAGNGDGLYLAEAIVCAFMYAAEIRADVASNS